MNINTPKRQLTATFLQLGANCATLLNQCNFSAFKFSKVSYCFALKTKVFTVTCVRVYILQIEHAVKLYNLAQKGSIRFTKLFIPCNSVHAYSPNQSPMVFLQLLYKFSLLALNIKVKITHLFGMSSSRNQGSQRRSRLNGSIHCVCLTVPGCIIL